MTDNPIDGERPVVDIASENKQVSLWLRRVQVEIGRILALLALLRVVCEPSVKLEMQIGHYGDFYRRSPTI